jgi:hypothetical protein
MKTIVLFGLGVLFGLNLFGQTEIKVPELAGKVVILDVANYYGTESIFKIEDGLNVSVELKIPTKKDAHYSIHLHAVANAIQQIIDQKYRLFSTEHVGAKTISIYYFVKD